MITSDVFILAYRTIRSNKLRTGLTVAIIAFGIMALVGIITAIKAMNQKLTESFSTMGANGFSIRSKEINIRINNNNNVDIKLSRKGAKKQKSSNLGKAITEQEAVSFVNRYRFPAKAGLSVVASRAATVTMATQKTNPNVSVFGADENYLTLNGLDLAAGRNFNMQEVRSGVNVCLAGNDVANKLFKGRINKIINSTIRINNIPYRVIGVLASRGATFGFSRDNIIVTSYTNVKRNFNSSGSYVIGILTNNILQMDEAIGEAEGLFRAIRKVGTTEENNFVIDRSNSLAEKAMNSLRYLTLSATVIGLITLIGAAIGLMNIMLVSVTERTKEVGLIKSIGGKSQEIRLQFLSEAILISVIGAFLGIILGILVGNIFSFILNTGFVVPWIWVFYGIFICTVVGVLAGLYPALKAGKLNPIEALRYE